MKDHFHRAPKKLSWLYLLMLSFLLPIQRIAQYIRDWIAIKTNRYTTQLGNAEIPRKWVHSAPNNETTQAHAGASPPSAAVTTTVTTAPTTAPQTAESDDFDIPNAPKK